MKSFLFLLFLFSNSLYPVFSQSNLLESVKRNPKEAINMCNKFREFNSKGISASADKAIEYVSKKNKLTAVNAEIFSIYVIGLHCPDII
jgi:GTP1/Obg family GTP-binding protein